MIQGDNSPAVYMIVGLGNPGRAYRENRHNVGFMLLDRLAENIGLSFSRSRHHALFTDAWIEGAKVILVKPQTFMNEAGRAIAPLVRFARIPLPRLLVVFDDLDLPLGTLRLRPIGGSSGHKGMRSIIQHLGSQDFPRLRVGIGRPPGRMDPRVYVLKDFGREERPALEITLQRGVVCVRTLISEGIEIAMTRFNAEVV